MTRQEKAVLKLKEQHETTWRNRGNYYWLFGLLEEVVELSLSLVGLHKHEPEIELRQISAIALNWLEMLEERAELGPANPHEDDDDFNDSN